MYTPDKMTTNKTIRIFLAACFVIILSANSSAQDIGDQLIPFEETTLDKKTINTHQVLRRGPIMLVFWASWCKNCAREIPLINELVQTPTGKNVQVISVNVGYYESIPKIERFIKKYGMKYPVIYDQTSRLTREYKIPGVPTIIIAKQNGTIVFRQHFVPNEQTLKELLR